MWNKWTKTTSIILTIGAIIGGYIFIDDRYNDKFALADELRKTNVRLEQKILQDRAWYVQKQMQLIEVKCSTHDPHKMPEHARERYNDFEIELKQLELKMKVLQNTRVGGKQ